MTRCPIVRKWLPILILTVVWLPLAGCGPSGDKSSKDKPAATQGDKGDKPAATSPESKPEASPDKPAPPKETDAPKDGDTPKETDAPKETAVDHPEEAVEEPEPAVHEAMPEEESSEPSEGVSKAGPAEGSQPAMSEPGGQTPAAEGEEDGGDFSLEELEASRKKIQEEMAKEELRQAEEQKRRIAQLGMPLVENLDKLVRLNKVYPVWTDPQKKRVIMVGEIAQTQVPLEMFACTRHTKEHESIIVVDTEAQIVHAGLLAVGAKPGRTVRFTPKYSPATGQEIAVTVRWKDADGKVQEARGEDWVRNAQTKKAMDLPWVFAGSMFAKDEFSGKTYYQADGGDFICVSNFSTAMLDLPVESSSVNQNLAYEAFTERIPERGTPVTLILTPKADKKPAAEGDKPKPEEEPKAEETPKPEEPKAESGEKAEPKVE